jgi:hypothetical protein
MNSIPCSTCGEGGHRIQRCPTLVTPLQPGFYAPPAGHRPSGDDDDEAVKIERPVAPTVNKSCQYVRNKL